MNLRQFGEQKLIQLLSDKFSAPHPSIRMGLGDDAAVIQVPPGKNLLVTTDMLVEGIDFDLRWITMRQLGHKTMAANLSDVASMGGHPLHAVVSLAVPPRTKLKWVKDFYSGLMGLAQRFKVSLVGGDTSASPLGIMVSVTLLGNNSRGLSVFRSGARPGDLIFVTHTLGDSKAGLEILMKSRRNPGGNSPHAYLIRRHRLPIPRIHEGLLLSSRSLASSMIDISDGLSKDLHHLCTSSRVGARIYLERIPISGPLKRYAESVKRSFYAYALAGGEDFELLFTVPRSKLARLNRYRSSGRIKAACIGEVTSLEKGIKIMGNHEKESLLKPSGYEHFRLSAP